ncbi:at hook motif family protein [Stylonychia lemnae]|uniref:At hook motif family protein n=1 Tax=Stylonychia lemnae TaxID=5949 RepID=A0A078ASC9_STYLE|nr:at hook motif family protein [Stylonychia lemnae]|eukprot:CDW85365.1 at hook motif family protein [Stylonychia lemnae]
MSQIAQNQEKPQQSGTKEKIKDNLNELFKHAIIGRSWKNKDSEVEQLFRMNPQEFADASQGIMLKILLITNDKQKSAEQLIIMFLKLYEIMNKFGKKDPHGHIDNFYQLHLETSFKLTQHKQKQISQRAYQWLLSVLENSQIKFLVDQRKIASRMLEVVIEKKKSEYIDVITNHLAKIMMEDESFQIRKEIISILPINERTLPFIIMKTQDKSFKVRQQVYISLKDKCKVQFHEFPPESKISLIVNGLSDIENSVKESCKDYLSKALCQKLYDQNIISDEDYLIEQVQNLTSTIQKLSLQATHNHHQISLVIYLLLRDVVFQGFGPDKVFSALQYITSNIEERVLNKQYEELYEDLVFMNFALHIIKKSEFDHQSYQFSSIEIQNHLPGVEQIERLIEQFQNNQNDIISESTYHQSLPNLIMYQCFHLMNHLIQKVKFPEKKAQIELIIKNFITKKEYFQFDLESKMTQDCLDQIQDEELALQELGVGIKDKEILIQISLMILKQVYENDNKEFLVNFEQVLFGVRSEDLAQENQNNIEKVQQKLIQYKEYEISSKEQINSVQSIGQSPDEKVLQKLQKAEVSLVKYQKMMEKLTKKDSALWQHQLTLFKYFLKVCKIDSETPTILSSSFQKIINTNLRNQNQIIKSLAVECLGLMMIQNKMLFEENVTQLIDYIQEEKQQKNKSIITQISLKCLFDGIMVHGFLLESGNSKDIQRQELRKILMRLLRDSDYNIRLLATEGFCRLLICERMQNPWDFIARLILLYFERQKGETDDLSSHQQSLLVKIKKSIEDFFTHFPRLGYDRCIELFEATLLAIYYLIKSRTINNSDPQWDKINIYYLFGKLSLMLQYKENKQFSIFDLAQKGISFQYQFIKFFSYLILTKKSLPDNERDQFAKFFIFSLQLIDLSEVPLVVPDYEREFKEFINPLFNQLSKFLQSVDQTQIIDKYWKKLVEGFVRRRIANSDSRPNHSIESEVSKIISDEIQRSKEKHEQKAKAMIKSGQIITDDDACDFQFDEDEFALQQHCEAFYNQTITYQKDFQEQKVVIEQQYIPNNMLIKKSLNDHQNDMKRAQKDLSKFKMPSLTHLVRENKPDKNLPSKGKLQNQIQQSKDSKSRKRDKKGKDKEKSKVKIEKGSNEQSQDSRRNTRASGGGVDEQRISKKRKNEDRDSSVEIIELD